MSSFVFIMKLTQERDLTTKTDCEDTEYYGKKLI